MVENKKLSGVIFKNNFSMTQLLWFDNRGYWCLKLLAKVLPYVLHLDYVQFLFRNLFFVIGKTNSSIGLEKFTEM